MSTTSESNFNQTTLLLGGDNATYIRDAGPSSLALTQVGSVRADQSTPFAGTGYYSGYFNGSTDYLSVPYGVWPASSTSWTLEGWFNFSNTSATKGILGIPDLIDFNYSGTIIVFS